MLLENCQGLPKFQRILLKSVMPLHALNPDEMARWTQKKKWHFTQDAFAATPQMTTEVLSVGERRNIKARHREFGAESFHP